MDEATEKAVADQRYEQESMLRPTPKLTTKPTTRSAAATTSPTTQPVVDTQLKTGVDSLRSFIIFQGNHGDFTAMAIPKTKATTKPATQPAG